MKIYSILFLAAIIVGSCANNKTTKGNNDIALMFEKTACFGTCPEFKLEVDNLGKATLYVIKNLELDTGVYLCSDCNLSQLKTIIEQAQKIGFKKLEGKYDPGVTDLPSIITTINNKKVINVMGGPSELKDLEKLINETYITRKTWKKR